MASKRFKGKDCAYCSKSKASTTDHVIAREFFFDEDRADLPKVPACISCNNMKSTLEHYATAALMAGSRHIHGDRYRRDKVAPRLSKNRKLQHDLGIDDPPIWMDIRGIMRPMHVLRLEPDKINNLMALIVKGLYCFHFGQPLDPQFHVDVNMFHPDYEPVLLAGCADYFPPGSRKVEANLGGSSFIYEVAQSPANPAFTLWRMAWHGGIHLHGANSPPQGVSVFWGVTRPTPEAVTVLKTA